MLLIVASLPAVYAYKYEEWFYWYDRPSDGTLTNLSRGLCNESLYGYWNASAFGSYAGQNAVQWCYRVEDCILGAMRPSYIQNYQAGNVILGIMPTLLASLGPRIAEISLLSTHRPFLSFLLSLGAPAVWPTRVFTYDDPAECLGSGVNRVSLPMQPRRRAWWISGLQYILTTGAIVNMVQTAIMLGRLTVLSWSCNFDYGPLAWAPIPLSIHLVGSVSYNFEIAQTEKLVRLRSSSNGELPISPLMRSMTFLSKCAELKWWQKEFVICANQPRGLNNLLKQKKMSWFAVFLNCIASTMAFFHILLGTMMFSSLIFIAVWDIMNSILWRYLLSTVICRLILLIELAGMREPGLKEIDELTERVAALREKLDGMYNKQGGSYYREEE